MYGKVKRGSCVHMIPCGEIPVPAGFYRNLRRTLGRNIHSRPTVAIYTVRFPSPPQPFRTCPR